MAKVIPVRIPDDLLARIETRCMVQKVTRTDVILGALRNELRVEGGDGSGDVRQGELVKKDYEATSRGRKRESASDGSHGIAGEEAQCAAADPVGAVPAVVEVAHPWRSAEVAVAELVPDQDPEPEPEMCDYEEWSGELGVMVRCGRAAHPLKPRAHGDWVEM